MTDVYQVEKIVGKRWKGGRVQYKVKWEGYPYSQCTWEPLEHLQTVFELIDQYNESQQTTSKKSKTKKELRTLLSSKGIWTLSLSFRRV